MLGFIVASGPVGRQCEAQRVASQPFRAGLRRRAAFISIHSLALQPALRGCTSHATETASYAAMAHDMY